MLKLRWDDPLTLLLVTGGLLGLTLPLGKHATAAGISPLLWAFIFSAGAGLVLLSVALLKGGWISLNPHRMRYFLIVGAVSFAIPNLMMFSVIPHLGAGYSGIMYTLSPAITLVLALLLRVRKPNLLGVAGIGVGFVGAVMVSLTRGEAERPAELMWVFIGLLIPVTVAAGNIYRTIDWPDDLGPIETAAGSHLAAAALLLCGLFATDQVEGIVMLGHAPLLVVVQIALASVMFVFYFRLQQVGGPVYLSQIGYVAAAVGLIIGTALLGERYQAMTWIGAVVITAGVILTTIAQRR